MPYIPQKDRSQYRHEIDILVDTLCGNGLQAGHLNYVISSILVQCMRNKGLCYEVVNIIDGVLGCACKEFYRRWVAPYEDIKISMNGDI